MKKSIYFRSIIFFLIVFFVSNTAVVLVLSAAYYNSVIISDKDLIEKTIDTVIQLDDYDIEDETIIEIAASFRANIYIYTDIQEIPNDYNKIDYSTLEQAVPQLYHGDRIYTAVKLDDMRICIVEPVVRRSHITISTAILYSTIITIVVAIFIILTALNSIVRPLSKISDAARKVATGNYDIALEPLSNKDALGQLIDDFNAMCKKLSETELMRKDFISAISHEFKTPLQSIHGFAELIQEDMNNPLHKDYLRKISDEAERLSSLSQNILQLNTLDNMIDIQDCEWFYLDEQVRQALLMLEHKWTKKEIRFNIDLSKVRIKANQAMMMQVLINLIDNAIKFTHQGGYIDLSLILNDDNIIFAIKDSGKGIDEEQKDRIFEQFYKCDHSRHSAGNGLGLTIVKRILDLHNFKISVHSVKAYGAEFKITIPLD